MTQYLLSVHTGNGQGPEGMSEEEMRAGYEQVARLEAEMQAEGALVYSGRLTDPGSATVVSLAEGEVVTTDGPYIEAKEAIGGFYIIEAPDLDRALHWATRTTEAIQMPIEVRPFFDAKQF